MSKKKKKKKTTMWINIYNLSAEHHAVSQYPFKTKRQAKAYVPTLCRPGREQYFKTIKIKF